jgi:hypothetical protein
MTDRERSVAWAETALRYLDALDTGDAGILAEMWEQAAVNPQLEQVLGELTDGLAAEEGLDLVWEADAERVRNLLRQHLPSAFPADADPPPLTVGDVAACLQADSALGSRLTAVDWVANSRLLGDPTSIPEELGLPHFEKWQTTLGISAGASYWRAFRQAAVLLAMGRYQQAGELAAARRVGRGNRSQVGGLLIHSRRGGSEMCVNTLWWSRNERDWETALARYWQWVNKANLALEQQITAQLTPEALGKLGAQDWYKLLHDRYFVWKYTQKNRYVTSVAWLEKMAEQEGGLETLHDIKERLLKLDKGRIRQGMETATEIPGLGVPGASGLLALMYPTHFGTVDRFVVEALQRVEKLPEENRIRRMNPEGSISVPQGVMLIQIMRRKAEELNKEFKTQKWTPRMIDMILWSCRCSAA